MNTQALNNIDSYLGYWLRFVSNQVSQVFQEKLANKNISVAEWFVLRTLWSQAPCSSTQLCEELSIEKGSMSRITDKLEKRKLIKRRTDKNDRRLYSIDLSSEGRQLVPELVEIADENDKYFFSHLSEQDLNKILSCLKSIVAHHHLKQKPID